MITLEKIAEWVSEAEKRPDSAALLVTIIANRLRDLALRNEELLNENIALLNGKRVEEYEQRIAYLEHQLELLKRRYGGDLSELEAPSSVDISKAERRSRSASLLIYNSQGRVARIEFNPEEADDGEELATLQGSLVVDQEAPRMLAVPSTEELLAVFSSGRVASLSVESISSAVGAENRYIDFDRGDVPAEPNAGEILVCLVPVAKLALSDFLVQFTRRGCVKKIAAGMYQSILANHFIGTGVILPADQTFDLTLCGKEDKLILVSHLGYLLGLEVKRLPFSIEESMRLTSGDFLEAALVLPPDCSILVVTQIGKLIHRTQDAIEMSTAAKSRGQAVFSAARREQGVRIVTAVAVRQGDWGAALHQDGRVTLHAIEELFASGTISTTSGLIAFSRYSLA
jgi:DNA gyrase/topoisomerase IV subunit A